MKNLRENFVFVGYLACVCGLVLLFMYVFRPVETPVEKAIKEAATPVHMYEDNLVRIQSNCAEGVRHWNTISIVEDKATGARVFCAFNTSGSCVAVCPLPPLPQVLEKAKP